jgi:hypothetical protein
VISGGAAHATETKDNHVVCVQSAGKVTTAPRGFGRAEFVRRAAGNKGPGN